MLVNDNIIKNDNTNYGLEKNHGSNIDDIVLLEEIIQYSSEKNPYLILNEEDLYELGRIDTKNKYFKLHDTITLTAHLNNPNGTNPNLPLKLFEGNFDGNNKQIIDIKINDSSSELGLFGKILGNNQKQIEIKNLTLKNLDIKPNLNTNKNAGEKSGSLSGYVYGKVLM